MWNIATRAELKSGEATCFHEWEFNMVDTIDKFSLHYCEILGIDYRSEIHMHSCILGESLKLRIKVGELPACNYHGAAVFASWARQ